MNARTDDQLFRTQHPSYFKRDTLDDEEPLLRRAPPSRSSLRIPPAEDKRDLNRRANVEDASSFITSIANIVRVASTRELHGSAGEGALNRAGAQGQSSQGLQVHRRSASPPEVDVDSVDLEDLRHRIVLQQIANSGPLSNLKPSTARPRTPTASFQTAALEEPAGSQFTLKQEQLMTVTLAADRGFGLPSTSPNKAAFEVRAWEIAGEGEDTGEGLPVPVDRQFSVSSLKGSPPPTNSTDSVKLASSSRTRSALRRNAQPASTSSLAMTTMTQEPSEVASTSDRLSHHHIGAGAGSSPLPSSRVLVLVSPFPIRTSPERPQEPWSLAVTPPPSSLPLATQRRNIALLSPSFDVEDDDTRHALGHLHYRINSVRALFALQNCERSEALDREGLLHEAWLSTELLRLQSQQHLERFSIAERERHQAVELASRLQAFVKATAQFTVCIARLTEAEHANRRGLLELETSARSATLTGYWQYLFHWHHAIRECLQTEESTRMRYCQLAANEQYHIQTRCVTESEIIWRRHLLLTPVLPTTFADTSSSSGTKATFVKEFEFDYDWSTPSSSQWTPDGVASKQPFHSSPCAIEIPISLLTSGITRSTRSIPCSVSEYFSRVLPHLFVLFIEEGNRLQLEEEESGDRTELLTALERKGPQFTRFRAAAGSGPASQTTASDSMTFDSFPSMTMAQETMRRTPFTHHRPIEVTQLEMERLMPKVALLTTMEFSNRTYWTAMEELQRHWCSSRLRLYRRESSEREHMLSALATDAPKSQTNPSTINSLTYLFHAEPAAQDRPVSAHSKLWVPTIAELFKLSDVHSQGRVTLAAVAGALRILTLPFNLQLLSQHFKAAQMRRADRMHRSEASLTYLEFCELCEASALLTGHIKVTVPTPKDEGTDSETVSRNGTPKLTSAASVTMHATLLHDRKLIPATASRADPEPDKVLTKPLVSPQRIRDQSTISPFEVGLLQNHAMAIHSSPVARGADLSDEQLRQCDAMFRRADKDEDGHLTRDELQRLLRRCGLLDDDSLSQEDFDELLRDALELAPTATTVAGDLVDSQQFQLIMAHVLRS